MKLKKRGASFKNKNPMEAANSNSNNKTKKNKISN